MGRHRSNSPHPVDLHVGRRLKLRRTLLGLSQQKLGDPLGLSFQQIQKYENGTNRISASRLYVLAQVLTVPVIFFFEGLPATASAPNMRHGLPPASYCGCGNGPDSGPGRETVKLVGAFHRIRCPDLRKKLLALVKSLGTGGARESLDTGSQVADAIDLQPAQSRDPDKTIRPERVETASK